MAQVAPVRRVRSVDARPPQHVDERTHSLDIGIDGPILPVSTRRPAIPLAQALSMSKPGAGCGHPSRLARLPVFDGWVVVAVAHRAPPREYLGPPYGR